MVYTVNPCVLATVCGCDQIPQQKKLMGKAFVSAYHYRGTQFFIAREAWRPEQETPWLLFIQTPHHGQLVTL